MLDDASVSWIRSARMSRIFALRWVVSVTIPACEPVNETAGSPWSMIAMHSSAAEMRSPEVSSMSISRAEGSPATSWARRSRSSVVLPMADTTTTTSLPARRVRTTCSATARRRSASATDVPPNFCTIKVTTPHRTVATDPILRRKWASVDSPAVPKATKRERQRQNRDARRAAMLAEEKRRRRFKSIRLFVIIIGAAVALAFLVSLTRSDDSDSSAANAISCTNKKPEAPPTNLQAAAPTCDDHRPDRQLRGHARHELRQDPDHPRRGDGAPDRQQLRVPRERRLLRRHDLPPHREGLRRPGR